MGGKRAQDRDGGTKSLTADSMRRLAPRMTADMTPDQLDELKDFLYQLAEWYVLHLESPSLHNPNE